MFGIISHGVALAEQGYAVIPIRPNSKAPAVSGWTAFTEPNAEVVRGFIDQGHSGSVGVVLGDVVAVDLDILDETVVNGVVQFITDRFGRAPQRIGNAPKTLLVFRGDGSMRKRSSNRYRDPETGLLHQVEVLAKGQQFVAYGIHPDRGEPYRWVGPGLAETPLGELPVLSADGVTEIIEAFETIRPPLWEAITAERTGQNTTGLASSALAACSPRMDITDAQVEEVLAALVHLAEPREDWIKMGMALHHQYDGSEFGLSLWTDWSANSVLFEEGECKRKWAGFGQNPRRRPVTFATFYKLWRGGQYASDQHSRRPCCLRPWDVPQASQIPPREWLVGEWIERSVVSSTIAPGGTGKSILTLAEAISLACDGQAHNVDHGEGIGLLGVPQKSGLKVGYVNLEDTGDEQDRRARAIIDHYGVDDSALGVRLFRLEDGAGLKVVKLQDGTVTRCEDVDTLKDAISSNRLDILYVDPFVSVHDVPENDNNAINAAIKVLAQVANDTSCAIHVVHHTTKQGDRALSQDSARGASAFVDGLRAARGVSTLTEAQAKKFGVGADYRAHKRIVSLKGNNSPGGHTAWFRLESVQLGQGDSVGVPVGWLPPQQRVTVFDPGQRAAVLEVFAEDAPNHFSCQSGHWVGHRICKALGEDSGTVEGKAIANKWIETLSEEGLIEKRSAPDKTSSRGSRPVWVSTSAQGFSDLESDVPK